MSHFNKRISMVLLVATVVLIFVLSIWIVKNNYASEDVYDVEVTNVSSSGASISWRTANPTKGSVLYSVKDFNFFNSLNTKKAFDDRDVEEVSLGEYKLAKQKDYYLHHVTLRGLNANTKYYFRIQVNQKIENKNNYDNILKTLDVIDNITVPRVIYGLVESYDKQPIEEVIVFFNLFYQEGEDTDLIKSARYSLITENGSYAFDANNVLDENGERLFLEIYGTQNYIQEVSFLAAESQRGSLLVWPGEDQPIGTFIFEDTTEHDDIGMFRVLGQKGSILKEVSAQSPCPSGNGFYCGGNLPGNGYGINELYKCEDGTHVLEKNCEHGCNYSPPGQNDFCKNAVGAPEPVGWSCTNDCLSTPGHCIATHSGNCYFPGTRGCNADQCGRGCNDLSKWFCGGSDDSTWVQGGNVVAPPVTSETHTNPIPPDSIGIQPGERCKSGWTYLGENFSDEYGSTCAQSVLHERHGQYTCDLIYHYIEKDVSTSRESIVCGSTPNYTGEKPFECVVDPDGSQRCVEIPDQSVGAHCESGYANSPYEDQYIEYSGPPDHVVRIEDKSLFDYDFICQNGKWEYNTCSLMSGVYGDQNNRQVLQSGTPGETAQKIDDECIVTYIEAIDDNRSCQLGYLEQTYRWDCSQSTKPDICNNVCDSSTQDFQIFFPLVMHSGNQTSKCPPTSDEEGVNYDSYSVETEFDGEVICVLNSQDWEADSGKCSFTYHLASESSGEKRGEISCIEGANMCSNNPPRCYSAEQGYIRKEMYLGGGSEQTLGLLNKGNGFVQTVKAQEDSYITLTEGGVYEIEGIDYGEFEILQQPGIEQYQVSFFEDLNENGVKDSDEPFIDHTQVLLKKKSDVFRISLEPGWNIISFPYLNEELKTVKDLITYINEEQNGYVTQIATYVDGNWRAYSQREEYQFAEDFPIMPTAAYFIKSYKNTTFSVQGHKIESRFQISLNNGWNLIGLGNFDKVYTARSLFDEFETQKIQADTISRWDSGFYTNYIRQQGFDYGNDFQIFPVSGYFVKVQGEKAAFYP